MARRIITLFVFIIILSLPLSCFGISSSSEDDFSTYKTGEDCSEVAKATGKTNQEFIQLCKDKNIKYFAINNDKSKQIIVMSNRTKFSENIVNLSQLSNDKINKLSPELIGNNNVNGQIITKDSQKYIKTMLQSNDSGGEYTVTQFITIAEKDNIILSVFSDKSSKKFADETFKNFDYKEYTKKSSDNHGFAWYFIIIIIALLVPLLIYIIFTLIRDIKKSVN